MVFSRSICRERERGGEREREGGERGRGEREESRQLTKSKLFVTVPLSGQQ